MTLGTAVGWLATMAWLRRRRAPVSAYEIGTVLLFGLLLSGVTWRHHLVVLVVAYPILLVHVGRRAPWPSWLTWLVLGA